MGSVMAESRLMMINLFIGFGIITVDIVFIKMIGDDGATQVVASLLYGLLHAQDFVGLYRVLHAQALYIPHP
jgi:hypothetical protein